MSFKKTFGGKSIKNNVDKSHHRGHRGYVVPKDPEPSLISTPKEVDMSSFMSSRGGTKRAYDDDEGYDDFRMDTTSKPTGLQERSSKTLLLPKRSQSINRSSSQDARTSDPFRALGKNQLNLPKKVNKLPAPSELAKKKIKTTIENEKDQCPYCGETFNRITEPMRKALDAIEEKDREYERSQKDKLEKESATSVYSLPTDLTIKRRVSSGEKDAFCKLHRIELVIKPEGIKKNYPQEINFDRIGTRIERMRPELDKIIRNKLPSEFRDIAENAYKSMGVNKARSTMGVMTRFEATLPGYYGPKGAAVILKVLTKLYLETGFLSRELVSPQLPLEFAQQVLVPEVGLRLIQGDLLRFQTIQNAREKARKLMEESIQYGHHMFPVKDQEINPHEFPTTTVLTSEEEEESDDDNDSVQELEFEHIEDSD